MRQLMLSNVVAIVIVLALPHVNVGAVHAVMGPIAVLQLPQAPYGLAELQVPVAADFANPYDPDDIQIVARFIGPDGNPVQVGGFWYVPYFRGTTGTGAAVHLRQPGHFRVRFAPHTAGQWMYTVGLMQRGEMVAETTPATFTVPAAQTDGRANGFIRIGAGPRRGFAYDDGTPFYGIGLNLAWWDRNPGDYDRWIPQLAAQGVNLIRLWMSPWSFGIEWTPGEPGDYDARQEHATQLDHVLHLAQQHGMHVLLVLNNHGQLSTNVDARWDDNPYNRANGGMLDTPRQFFTNEQAKQLFKQRVDYIINRWGHHTSVLAWELWNEVDLTAAYDPEAVIAWHREMSAFIKEKDPYGHLVSTSFANSQREEGVWQLPHIDFTMTHFYNVSDMVQGVHAVDAAKLAAYGKPTFAAEFGVSLDKAQADPQGVFFHNGLWAGLFSGGAATPMSWWWNNYLEPRGLFPRFQSLRRFLDHTVHPVHLTDHVHVTIIDDAFGDTTISTTLGWGAMPDGTDVVFHDDGTARMPMSIASYMMGTVFNTHLRSDALTFHFVADVPTRLDVLLEGVSAAGAVLMIRMDGEEALRQVVNTRFIGNQRTVQVPVPAGTRIVTVENTGTDWLQVSGFILREMGTQSRVFGVQGAGDIVLWIQDRNHTYAGVTAGYVPTPIANARLVLDGIESGTYDVLWWNTWHGELIKQETMNLSPGAHISVPVFEKDIAVRLRRR